MKLKLKGDRKYHYFYKITNLVNNHFYYGIHSTNNMDDGYMGSGKRLLMAYKKYGIENFRKDILVFFNKREDAVKYEEDVVTETLTKDENCYNIIPGGEYMNSINLVTVYDSSTNTYRDISMEEYRKNKHLYRTYSSGKVFCTRVDNGEKVEISVEEYHNNKEQYRTYSANKNKILCKNKSGKVYLVYRDDSRYVSGDLIPFQKGRNHTQETKDKMKLTYKKIKHQQGSKNSQ